MAEIDHLQNKLLFSNRMITYRSPLLRIAVNLGVVGTKVTPPFFKEKWPDHKIVLHSEK